MSGWQALADEAARWRDAGRTAELWWRDDDAIDATPLLDRLVGLVRDTQTPLALAVVPAQATPALAARLADINAARAASLPSPSCIAALYSAFPTVFFVFVEATILSRSAPETTFSLCGPL